MLLLQENGVPHYMVAGISSFLSQRTCRLLFQGSPKTFSPVQVSTPQGSPISPLLFVIYVASAQIEIPEGLSLSYVDDFGLSAASTSYKTNVRAKQWAFGPIRACARARKVGFSAPKTELIHGRTPLQRDSAGAPSRVPICLDGQIFPSLTCLRWLGYWLSPNLASSAHFSKQLRGAQGAIATIKRLSRPAQASCLTSLTRLSYHCSSPSSYMGPTSWSPAEAGIPRWTSTGDNSNTGYRTASCQPLYPFYWQRPAFPPFKPLSLISLEWLP